MALNAKWGNWQLLFISESQKFIMNFKKNKTEMIILIIGILLVVYGYWGVFTESGSKVYEGMSGMIPFYLGLILGGSLLSGWLVYRIYVYFS